MTFVDVQVYSALVGKAEEGCHQSWRVDTSCTEGLGRPGCVPGWLGGPRYLGVVRTSRSFRFLERRNETNGFWKTFRSRSVACRVWNSLSIRVCGPGSRWLHVHTRGTLLLDWVFLGLPSRFWRGIAFTAANCRSIRAAGYPRLLRKKASSLSLDSRVSGWLMMVWRRITRPYCRFRWTWGGWSLDRRRYGGCLSASWTGPYEKSVGHLVKSYTMPSQSWVIFVAELRSFLMMTTLIRWHSALSLISKTTKKVWQ